jgi:hypothetical protein
MIAAKKRVSQKETTKIVLEAARRSGELPKEPKAIMLTRIAPRQLDEVNLLGGLKHIQDAVCSVYGIDDGPKGKVKWYFDQVRGRPREYAWLVEVIG